MILTGMIDPCDASLRPYDTVSSDRPIWR